MIGRIGRDLNVSSVPDTGKVKGKEFDISATVTIGPGGGVSGSVGYGQTNGKTNWVEDQTRITGRDKVDIRTENHTQLDGALIASDNGNLKLDTASAVAGLNRDVSKASEITKDKENRTDLYITDSSLTMVKDPAAMIKQWKADSSKYGDRGEETINLLLDLISAGADISTGKTPDAVYKKMFFDAFMRKLGSRNAQDRASTISQLVAAITPKEQTPDKQALVDRLTQVSGGDPNKAFLAIMLLAELNTPGTRTGEWETVPANFVVVPFVAAGAAAAAIGAALVATDATMQEKMRIAANSLVESGAQAGKGAVDNFKVSADLWGILFGTAFPIHLLDPENKSLINPIFSGNDEHPSSGGFGNGNVISPIPHTGGTQLDGQRDDGKYVTPEHHLDPGNVYSDRVELRGLTQNRPLQDLTHQELIDVFSGADINLSSHAVGRLKDYRTKNIGFETPNDIAQIFNKGTKFDAGDGTIGYSYRDLEAIVNPVINKVITFRPAKKGIQNDQII